MFGYSPRDSKQNWLARFSQLSYCKISTVKSLYSMAILNKYFHPKLKNKFLSCECFSLERSFTVFYNDVKVYQIIKITSRHMYSKRKIDRIKRSYHSLNLLSADSFHGSVNRHWTTKLRGIYSFACVLRHWNLLSIYFFSIANYCLSW